MAGKLRVYVLWFLQKTVQLLSFSFVPELTRGRQAFQEAFQHQMRAAAFARDRCQA